MSKRQMRPGLAYDRYSAAAGWFFERIDATGGWPIGFDYCGFEHTSERAAGFCNSPHNDGWWTVVASADDYHMWKLSPAALQRIVDAAIRAIRLPGVDASRLFILDSRGHPQRYATPAPTSEAP